MQSCTIVSFSNGKSINAYWSEYKEENPEIYLYDNNTYEDKFICEICLDDFKKLKNN